jgi:hypothetical protein
MLIEAEECSDEREPGLLLLLVRSLKLLLVHPEDEESPSLTGLAHEV